MNLVIFENSNGRPQCAAFGTDVDREMDRIRSGTLGGSFR